MYGVVYVLYCLVESRYIGSQGSESIEGVVRGRGEEGQERPAGSAHFWEGTTQIGREWYLRALPLAGLARFPLY
jgi:hypothetical protein